LLGINMANPKANDRSDHEAMQVVRSNLDCSDIETLVERITGFGRKRVIGG
jgi:hypothetical protein